MSIFNKLSCYAVAAGLGLMALSSCSNDDIDYTPGTYPNASDVYFEVQPTVKYSVGTSDTEFIFNVYRVSADAPASVTLNWSGDTKFFDLPKTATFEEDNLETQVVGTYDVSAFEAMKPYTLKVEIPGIETTPYTQSYIDFEFTYFPMSEWELFGFNEDLGRDGLGVFTFANYYGGSEDPVKVESCFSLIDENEIQYRFMWLIDNDNPDAGWETFLTAESHDGGKTIRIPEQVFAYNANYGDVYASDMYTYTGDASYDDSYFDDVTGTFYLDIIYYVDGGYFGYGYETCVMNGYLDTNDYTVSLSDLGMVTIGDTNYELVTFHWDAAALVKYTAVETSSISEGGEVSESLLAKLAQDMTDDKVDCSIAKEQGNYSFSFDAKGNYTVVAVGYKEENDGNYTQQSVQYISFDYTTTDPNQGWKVLGYVQYTDGFISVLYGEVPPTYYVEIQESEETPGLYRLVNAYGADFPYIQPGEWNPDVTSYLYVNASNPECVFIPMSPQTLNWGDGPLSCYSFAANYLEAGKTEAEVIQAGYAGTLKDGKITFPPKTLYTLLGSDAYYGNIPVDGETEGPFLIDLNTITQNPSDAAKAKAKNAKLKAAKKGKKGHLTSGHKTKVKKTAHVVNFKSKALNSGNRKAPKFAPVPGRLVK